MSDEHKPADEAYRTGFRVVINAYRLGFRDGVTCAMMEFEKLGDAIRRSGLTEAAREYRAMLEQRLSEIETQNQSAVEATIEAQVARLRALDGAPDAESGPTTRSH